MTIVHFPLMSLVVMQREGKAEARRSIRVGESVIFNDVEKIAWWLKKRGPHREEEMDKSGEHN